MRVSKIIINLLPVVILLVVFFSAFCIAETGFVHENAETAAIVSIAIMSAVYPMYLNIASTFRSKQVRKTKIVIGTSHLELKRKINDQLKDMKKKTILSVQITDGLCALIIYTD